MDGVQTVTVLSNVIFCICLIHTLTLVFGIARIGSGTDGVLWQEPTEGVEGCRFLCNGTTRLRTA